MATDSAPYAARLEIDYPGELDRVTTLLRIIWVIPIAIVFALVAHAGQTVVVDEAGQVIRRPPWAGARPELVPAGPWPPEAARQVAPPPRFGFLGRSLTGTGGPYATVYLDALLDQVVRANQQGRIDRPLELSDKRLRLAPDGEADAWRLESLRRAGRGPEAERLLRSLPESTRRHPSINVVLALFDRDSGEERRARALLGSVADSFPGTPVEQALAAPLAQWPSTLDAMTAAPRRDAIVASGR